MRGQAVGNARFLFRAPINRKSNIKNFPSMSQWPTKILIHSTFAPIIRIFFSVVLLKLELICENNGRMDGRTQLQLSGECNIQAISNKYITLQKVKLDRSVTSFRKILMTKRNKRLMKCDFFITRGYIFSSIETFLSNLNVHSATLERLVNTTINTQGSFYFY